MEIRLRPELEKLIEEDVQRGPYQNVDEFVERAVSLLHEQEAWLASHGRRSLQKSKRDMPPPSGASCATQVRRRLEDRKRTWLDEHRDR